PLEERALVREFLEALERHEPVVVAVDLAGARPPRRVRHRKAQPIGALQRALEERRLAGAGGTRHHYGNPLARRRLRRSRAAHSGSPSSPCGSTRRVSSVSACTADRITWSESATITERVLRPCVASTSFPRSRASSRMRRTGDAFGDTTAMI